MQRDAATDRHAGAPNGRSAGGWSVRAGRCCPWPANTHSSRTQFGKPIAGFQAIRHELAETYVAIEGAEATL